MTPGQNAFEAYNAVRGGLTHDGKPTPPWGELGDGERAAWDTAARVGYLAVSFEARECRAAAVARVHASIDCSPEIAVGDFEPDPKAERGPRIEPPK